MVHRSLISPLTARCGRYSEAHHGLDSQFSLGNTMARRHRVVRMRTLHDQGMEEDLNQTTPAQRLSMMWQLALDAWAFKGESLAESRLPRHVVCVVRRRR